MPLYRFLDRRWLESTLDGKISLGRLNYYRLMERAYGTPWIGDRWDGVKTYRAENIGGVAGSPGAQRAVEMGLVTGMGPGSKFFVGKLTQRVRTDCFVQSLAEGTYDELAPIFAAERNGVPGYTTCIEIADPGAYFNAMETAVAVGPPALAGAKMADIAADLSYRHVTYSDDPSEFQGFELSSGDAFLKRKMYEEQREFRIALTPKHTVDADRIDLQLDLPPGTLSVVAVGSASFPSPPDNTDHFRILADLLRQHEEFPLPKYPTRLDYEAEPWKLPEAEDSYLARDKAAKEEQRRVLEVELFPQMVAAYWKTRSSKRDARLDEMFTDGPEGSFRIEHLQEYLGIPTWWQALEAKHRSK